MQIVITLNSYEELQELRDNLDKLMAGKSAPAPVTEEKPKKATTKKADPAPDPEPVKDPEPAQEKPAGASESDVKVLLAEKIKGGKKAEVRALFEEYGVTKLSELIAQHPDKLAEFAEKAEAL